MRPPVLKDHKVLHCNITEPVPKDYLPLRDHIFMANRVVVQDGFYFIVRKGGGVSIDTFVYYCIMFLLCHYKEGSHQTEHPEVNPLERF